MNQYLLCFWRFATCHLAWRRCSADISWHTTQTGPWQSASCATRSSPGMTTSKYIWRMSTGRRRARANYGSTNEIPQIKFSLVLCTSKLHTYCIHRWLDSRNVDINNRCISNMGNIKASILKLKHRLYCKLVNLFFSPFHHTVSTLFLIFEQTDSLICRICLWSHCVCTQKCFPSLSDFWPVLLHIPSQLDPPPF